jgi:hypothetical protein
MMMDMKLMVDGDEGGEDGGEDGLWSPPPMEKSWIDLIPESWSWLWQWLVAVLATQLGTPRGRYDEHNGKFPSVWNQGLIEPVGEGNHFWRLMLTGFGDSSRQFVYGAYLGRSFGTSSNVEPAHNTTKVLCPNLQWGCQSHRFAMNKGLNVSCGKRYLFARK